MAYCRACGTELPGAPPVECSRCGTWEWRNAKPAAAALVTDGESLLFIRRAQEPWRDHWTPPGGFCDEAEHPIAAAERETLEEVGLTVEATGYLGTWLSSYDDTETIAVAYYHARLLGSPTLEPDPAEVVEARWFAPDTLPGLLAPPTTLPLVLAAWRQAVSDGRTVTALYDRPS